MKILSWAKQKSPSTVHSLFADGWLRGPQRCLLKPEVSMGTEGNAQLLSHSSHTFLHVSKIPLSMVFYHCDVWTYNMLPLGLQGSHFHIDVVLSYLFACIQMIIQFTVAHRYGMHHWLVLYVNWVLFAVIKPSQAHRNSRMLSESRAWLTFCTDLFAIKSPLVMNGRSSEHRFITPPLSFDWSEGRDTSIWWPIAGLYFLFFSSELLPVQLVQ